MGHQMCEKMYPKDFGIKEGDECRHWWCRYAEGCQIFTTEINKIRNKMLKAGNEKLMMMYQGKFFRDHECKEEIDKKFTEMLERADNAGWFSCPFLKDQTKCPYYKKSREIINGRMIIRFSEDFVKYTKEETDEMIKKKVK